MTIEIIGLIAAILGILGLVAGPAFLVFIFITSTLLGASAAVVLDSLGGASISPAHLLLGFVVVCLLSHPAILRRAVGGLAFPKAGFWLLVTAGYGICTAIFLPRVFAGLTYVFPVRSDAGYTLVPLESSTANFTQSVYFTSDFICFIALYGYASLPQGWRLIAKAALFCAGLNLAFGALDILTYWTNTTELLAFIRNANYRMLNDTEVAGFKRIVGSFTEAAAFGSTTLGYFAFCLKLWLQGFHTRLTFILAILSLVAMLFSTSTTAYVGLSTFLLLVYLECLIKLLSRPVPSQTVMFLIVAPILASLVVVAIALNDASWNYVRDLLDTMVFNKLSTDSGVERSSWNSQAIQNFFDTWGLGAGNGSVRAASFLAAVLASLGAVGACTYGAFLLLMFLGNREPASPDRYENAVNSAAKSVCLAWFIASSVAGAFIDLSLPFFVFAALACAKKSSPVSTQAAMELRRFETVAPSGGAFPAQSRLIGPD
jgi:hypothetical protein